MSGCCEPPSFDGQAVGYKRALWAVIFINAVMFFVEITAGLASESQALKADALDFAGDSVTYALSLFVIGASLQTRALASLFKAGSLGAIALFVLITTALRFFSDAAPDASTMSLIGCIALLIWPFLIWPFLSTGTKRFLVESRRGEGCEPGCSHNTG